MKHFNKVLPTILFGGILMIMFTGCDTGHPTQVNKQFANGGIDSDGITQEKVLPTSWPPAVPEDKSMGVAPDLLAKNFMVVLDDSGSMDSGKCSGNASDKLTAAKKAMTEFSKSVPENANLGLVLFKGGVIVPLAGNAKAAFESGVHSASAGGSTPLNGAVNAAYEALTIQGIKQLGYGEYHIVVVTDGGADNATELKTTVNWISANTPIIVQTIGFCIGEGHSLNQPGKTIYRVADNPQELRDGLTSVLAESTAFDVADFE